MKQITLTITLNAQDVKGLATELAYEVDDFLTNLGTVADWDIQFDSKMIVEEKRPSGAHVPNPDCKKCMEDEIACISCYMAQGGYND